jgi:hypothetical protein
MTRKLSGVFVRFRAPLSNINFLKDIFTLAYHKVVELDAALIGITPTKEKKHCLKYWTHQTRF